MNSKTTLSCLCIAFALRALASESTTNLSSAPTRVAGIAPKHAHAAPDLAPGGSVRTAARQVVAAAVPAIPVGGGPLETAAAPGPVTSGINYDVPNFANSPLPKVVISGITVVNGGSGYSGPTAAVTITGIGNSDTATANITGGVVTSINGLSTTKVYYGPPTITVEAPTGAGQRASATANVTIGRMISSISVELAGAGYTGPTAAVTISGLGNSDNATASVTDGVVTSITGFNSSKIYYSTPTITIAFPETGTDRATATANLTAAGNGMRKFVDSMAGLTGGSRTANTALGENNLHQYMPLAVADPDTYSGSDYFEIALVEYTEQMHSDLPATTKLRGYVQIYPPGSTPPEGAFALKYPDDSPITVTVTVGETPTTVPVYGHDKPHFLGPIILATAGRPTRIKFYNLLPTGASGDLFLPVDTTIMGAGMGPLGMDVALGSPMNYAQNRATLHLHGGFTPWISDGTPHQWTVPAGESTPVAAGETIPDSRYKKGVSTKDVPDMGTTADGVMTFYYPNAQSGRLMFYHDHAYGITRLNVYGGEAAGYLLVDPEEDTLAAAGVPGTIGTSSDLPHLIPMVIQDKTFVPETVQLTATDPLWLTHSAWGGNGNLWFPHVYMPNQNPQDPTGANMFGRWDYGPWFWPPQASTQTFPEVSTVPEAFMDVPIVNGTAFPYLNVAPTKYRLRILNACNDRMVNLQLYVADPDGFKVNDGTSPWGTEVAMIPAVPNAAINFPPLWLTQTPGMIPDVLDNRVGGVPHPDHRGPAMIQIGTEGGLLPAPVLLPNTPVGYEQNKRNIVVLNVVEKTLFLGPAERADVIVDFSKFAGKSVILYNDAPAPVPAPDPRYDYYTGNPDNTSQGGAPTTLPGYGPNTRTIMQFRVSATGGTSTAPPDDYDPELLTALQASLPEAYTRSQPPPVLPQVDYPPSYANPYDTNTYVNIADTSVTFVPYGSTEPVTYQLQPKCIQELFDPYGRMNSLLGVEIPFTTFFNQTTIPYSYIDPTTETIPEGETQFWKITHNGVDTHAIHFHLLNVQVINRVGWDGAIRPPDPNELGWRETVRMNPLEDIIVAATASTPPVPAAWGGLPISVRPLDVTAPLHSTAQFSGVDPNGLPVTVSNEDTDFGYEYVWHCHLLGHEENDMMRPLVLRPAPSLPTGSFPLRAVVAGPPLQMHLTWTPPAGTVASYTVQRATGAGIFANLASGVGLSSVTVNFSDNSAQAGNTYTYKILAFPGAVESTTATVTTPSLPSAPLNLSAALGPGTAFVLLNWQAAGANATGLTLQRATDAGFTKGLTSLTLSPTSTHYEDTVVATTTYYYKLSAFSPAGNSAPSSTVNVTSPALPGTPSTPTKTIAIAGKYNLIAWNVTGGTSQQLGYYVWRSTDDGVTWTLLNSTTAQSYKDQATPQTTGTTYLYRVQAWNAFGVKSSGTLTITK